jgi:4-hydroxy 2-oxovalerate aldolase
MKTKILDCTLRDGGYYTNWDFDPDIVEKYIKYSNELNIDYIEIGYRNNKNPIEYKGQFYYSPKGTLEYFKKNSNHKIALMIDFKSIDLSQAKNLLLDCVGLVDLIRIAASPDQLDNIQPFISQIKNLGFEVALNIMYLSNWNITKMKKSLANIKDVDFIYLVDSFGSVFPDQLEKIINEIKSISKNKLGFHSHDNIELAFSNTLTAINNKIDIVDSTILGMGRGAGNLKTELLLMKLIFNSKESYKTYDALSNLVEAFLPLKQIYNWGSDISYKFAGINSYPQKDIMFLKLSKNYEFSQILGHFEKKNNKKTSLKDISLSIIKNNLDTIIVGGGISIKSHENAIQKFIKKKNYNIIFLTTRYSNLNDNKFSNVFQIVLGSDVSKIKKIKSKNIKYIFPLNEGENYENKEFYSFKIEDKFQDKINHVLASLLLVNKITKSKNIFALGFDGFDQSNKYFNVFEQNEEIFKSFKNSYNITSLTDTKYSIKSDSIYSYL